jgi:hypothetical protein
VGHELHFQPTHSFSLRGPLFPVPALTLGGHWSVAIPSPLSHAASTAGGTGLPASDARSATTQNPIIEIEECRELHFQSSTSHNPVK